MFSYRYPLKSINTNTPPLGLRYFILYPSSSEHVELIASSASLNPAERMSKPFELFYKKLETVDNVYG